MLRCRVYNLRPCPFHDGLKAKETLVSIEGLEYNIKLKKGKQ